MFLVDSPSNSKMIINCKSYINFTGCSYLGISEEKNIINAGINALKKYGSLCQTPRHYDFYIQPYLDVVEEAKDFFNSESAAYFSTGYLFANIVMQGIIDEYDVIFLDEKAHYSINDACMATGKPIYRYKHSDARDVKKVISKKLKINQIPIIVTDGMFPTYGNIPPLNEYYDILCNYNGWMVVDESHSLGTIGENGRGSIEKFNLPRDKVIGGGSMAKAFCAYGGIILANRKIIDVIINSAPFRGTSSPMVASAAMTAESLRYVKKNPELLINLRKNIRYIKEKLTNIGISIDITESPNATFVLGNSKKMKKIQKDIFDNGVCITYSNYIGAGKEGVLKCSIFSSHTKEDIDKLISLLKNFL